MIRPGFAMILGICALALMSTLTVGCDEETIISPFSGRDAHFTVWGYISTTDTQLVRIVPIRSNLARDSENRLLDDVTVTTTELNSGRVDEWHQVTARQPDGSTGLMFSDSTFGYVFRGFFTPNAGNSYELKVEHNDGRTSTARATIPHVDPPVVGSFDTRGAEVHQTITWPNVQQQPFAVMTLYVLSSDVFKFPRVGIRLYHNNTGRIGSEGLEIDVNLNEDVRLLRKEIVDNLQLYSNLPAVEDPNAFHLVMSERRMRIFVGDSTWNFISENPDQGRLSQPGANSTVEDGFGFFGALGTNFGDMPINQSSIRQQIGFTF